MIKPVMSTAAAGVLRSLISRSGVGRNRFLLTEVTSTDWQSLTFSGERHEIHLRISGSDAAEAAERLCAGLEEAEFAISGPIVADIAVEARAHNSDGSVELTIGALTLAGD